MLKCNGNFNVAVSLLMEKARKAYRGFKIKKTIGLNNPCKLLEKLFDSPECANYNSQKKTNSVRIPTTGI
jgi:hypothetical protein